MAQFVVVILKRVRQPLHLVLEQETYLAARLITHPSADQNEERDRGRRARAPQHEQVNLFAVHARDDSLNVISN